MNRLLATFFIFFVLGCSSKNDGALLSQNLVGGPAAVTAAPRPLAIEASIARLMPDQLSATAASTFGMEKADLNRIVGSPQDVQALGGLPFGTTGLSIQYRPTFGLTLFIARAFDPQSANSADSNGFCGPRGAIAQISTAAPRDRVRDLALLLWGELPSEEEMEQWVALGASAAESGVSELEGICVGMLHDARFVTY